ncbi:hypothetical protein FKP32DRAFT_1682285 [Trametes sanguinea]|nr:hypothetical protein FKP32DRAFT_1682285 [Trametes sanguinea]
MPVINALNFILATRPKRTSGETVEVERHKFLYTSPTAPPVNSGSVLEPGVLPEYLLKYMSMSYVSRSSVSLKKGCPHLPSTDRGVTASYDHGLFPEDRGGLVGKVHPTWT